MDPLVYPYRLPPLLVRIPRVRGRTRLGSRRGRGLPSFQRDLRSGTGPSDPGRKTGRILLLLLLLLLLIAQLLELADF